MADALFDQFKEQIMLGTHDMVTDVISLALVKNTYTFDGADEFVSDIPSASLAGGFAARVVVSATKSTTLGVFTSTTGSQTFTAIDDGTIDAYILFMDTTVDTTSRLIGYFDSPAEFPIVTNGGDITINRNASGYFKL